MTDPTPDDPKALAGELALRVLPDAEERLARAREAADPAFAAEVAAWNEHLAAFAEEIRPVQPSPGVWPRVEAGISPVANDNGRAGFWRTWAVGSTGLLAASLVAVAVLIARPAPAPIVQTAPAPVGVTRVATLASPEGGAPVIALAYDTATGNLFVIPTGPMNAGGVPHLWLVKPDGAGVQLIGAIDGSTATKQTLTSVLADAAGEAAAVAISIEAPGHTPAADKPDGPVVASGALTPL
ncbi:MAG: anti-sigma factor [Pseudomonadota bacterium]